MKPPMAPLWFPFVLLFRLRVLLGIWDKPDRAGPGEPAAVGRDFQIPPLEGSRPSEPARRDAGPP